MFGKSRRHAASLASCFSQLGHKAGLVFQTNAKLEAELVHLREELASTRVTVDQIHRCLIEPQSRRSLEDSHCEDFTITRVFSWLKVELSHFRLY